MNKFRIRLKLPLSLLMLAITVASHARADEFSTFSWQGIDGADYYAGTYTNGLQTTHFRTKGRKILLADVGEIKIRAFNRRNRPIATEILVTRTAPPKGEVETTSQSDSDLIPTPVPAIIETKEYPASSPEDHGPKDDGSENSVAGPPPEEVARLIELEREEKDAFSQAPYRNLVIYLGIGREDISATGGSSEFTGQAGVGGTTVELSADLSHQVSTPIGINFAAHGHNFTTNQSNARETKGDQQTVTTTYQFVDIQGDVRYLLTLLGRVNLGLGFGISRLNYPRMAITNDLTGESELEVASALGANIALSLTIQLAEMGSSYSALRLYPQRLGLNSNIDSGQIQSFWRYPVIENLFLNLGISHTRKFSSDKLACATGRSECISQGRSSSITTSFLMGAGVKF